MKKISKTKAIVLFLSVLVFTSCSVSRKCCNSGFILKSDSTVYAKFLNDSIAEVVLNSDVVICQLQSLNPVDSIRTDSIRTLPSKLNAVIKYLFFEPSNFKSNDIVYGHFSSSARYTFKTPSGQMLYWELDFGLKKWKLLNVNGEELCICDMKASNLFLLRLTRIIFPTDMTLSLLYNNLAV